MTLNVDEYRTGDDVLPPAELDFSRTVDRGLVHRSAVSEVFVTDIRAAGDDRVWCAIQLPLTHGYYSDHLQQVAAFDPLLLLESCRQAAIGGSHTHAGISRETATIVDTFRLECTWLPGLVMGRAPGALGIETVFAKDRTRSGRLRSGSVRQRLFVDGVGVGTHTMRVSFLRASQAEALRHAQRGTPAPTTANLADTAPADQVAPAEVCRVNPRNVVLAAHRRTGSRLTAEVAPHPHNRALFDHDYDHYPAMTLVEAARQVALLAAEGSAVPRDRLYPDVIEGRFMSYAELDERLEASAATPTAAEPPHTSHVVFTQGERTAAEVTVGMADAGSAAWAGEKG